MPAARLASLIRRRLGAPNDHPLDPEEIAHLLGYAVIWTEPAILGAASGFALEDEIHVARTGMLARDRWTLAHEIAHAEARRHGMDWLDEGLANGAAAELLMPAAALRPIVSTDPDIPALAATYRTSLEAAARRTIDLRPGYVSIVSDSSERSYSSVGLPPRRIAAAAMGLARRCRRRGSIERFRFTSWDARGWIDDSQDVGIAVVLRS